MTEKKLNVYQKLTKIQNELLKIHLPKSGKNDFGGYNYYELDTLLPPITELCEKYDATYFFDFPVIDGMDFAEIHFLNAEDPSQEIISSIHLPKLEKLPKMNLIQSAGTYETYTKRYLILNLFDIVEDEIIDALNPNSEENQKPRQKNNAPASLSKVIKKHPDADGNKKLLNKYSSQMFKNKELTNKERKEIFEYVQKMNTKY